ncbi:Metallo-dependent phosphatase [Anaeromyces robustus]|uniref:Metallo-dependent phosphatase n=1 Tax=Anaeromyces robustus TaxID=1754192 RepID=A0A1Y1X1I5_9FUNG|nr:Metallo-dependent phosphatase [Anaeromyces robustus]|eukprot:ORX79671.1 Metallo-dependent phosphatase [Anaeromyces robustus]
MANTLLNLRKDPYTIEYLATQNDYKYQKVIEDYKLSDVIKWKDTIVREGSEYFTKSKYKYKRIIAIGDIHGDYEKLKNVLRHAKLIDKNNKWIATDTALVQVGDLTDRGAGFKKIMELLKKLRDEAKKKKSAVFMLLGNHELFDMQAGYFVLQKSDFDAFGGYLERERALSMDDMYGQLLRKEMNVTMLIDDNLFVHAGLRYKYAKKGIDELNKRAHDILTNVPSFDELLDDYYNKDKTHPLYSDYVFDMIDGPLWTDFFSSAPSDEVCEELEKVLKVTKAKRMIVGHTIQDYGRIRTNCHKKLIFIDIALSNCIGDYFGYLEILNDKKQIWTRYE